MSKQESHLSPKDLVANIVNRKIYLKNISEQTLNTIKNLGALSDEIAGQQYWLIKYTNDQELAQNLHVLNQLGFLFIGGSTGWTPAAVFDHLRKKQLLNEKFKEISWRGPDDWFITER